MLSTTKATISINGANFSPLRDGFLEDFNQTEALLDESLKYTSIYKRDLFMFGEGDLFVNSRQFFNDGDLKDIGGLLNYAQAITHRLMTTRGTHPEDRFFGVPWGKYLGVAYVSKNIVSTNLIADITEELYKDSRTSEVVSISINFISNTVLEVACSVRPIMYQQGSISISLSVEDRQ